VDALERLADAHARDGASCYYAVRERFNARRRAGGGYTPDLAAMLIYLNRTGFNGLFRVNASGAFNVPAGRYVRPQIANARLVHATAAALASSGVQLAQAIFDDAVAGAGRGHFVYCDPPYAPLSATSAFDAYTTPRFTDEDQVRLRDTVVALAERGASVMVSNSSAPVIERLYGDAARAAAALALWQVPARRAINSSPDMRGPVRELLLTTLVPRKDELPEGVERIV
jgi:DNA adenine methylase